MKFSKLKFMEGGWFIGDFSPSFFRSKAFEVAFKKHAACEKWPKHIQKKVTEINLLIRGSLTDRGYTFGDGDLWHIEPGEVSEPKFLSDCEVICIKVPSLPKDKKVIF